MQDAASRDDMCAVDTSTSPTTQNFLMCLASQEASRRSNEGHVPATEILHDTGLNSIHSRPEALLLLGDGPVVLLATTQFCFVAQAMSYKLTGSLFPPLARCTKDVIAS